MSFELMRPKWRCFAAQHHVWKIPTAYQHKHLIPTVGHDRGGVMIGACFCRHMTWAPCSHWVDHGLVCMPKCSRFKCEATCLAAILQTSMNWINAVKKSGLKGLHTDVRDSKPHRKWLLYVIADKGSSTSCWITGYIQSWENFLFHICNCHLISI